LGKTSNGTGNGPNDRLRRLEAPQKEAHSAFSLPNLSETTPSPIPTKINPIADWPSAVPYHPIIICVVVNSGKV
jgi:hypothetical protein